MLELVGGCGHRFSAVRSCNSFVGGEDRAFEVEDMQAVRVVFLALSAFGSSIACRFGFQLPSTVGSMVVNLLGAVHMAKTFFGAERAEGLVRIQHVTVAKFLSLTAFPISDCIV